MEMYQYTNEVRTSLIQFQVINLRFSKDMSLKSTLALDSLKKVGDVGSNSMFCFSISFQI